MSPKKSVSEKKRSVYTIELKKEIVKKFEAGAGVSKLSREFKIPKTTIFTIVKKRDEIKKANLAKGATILTQVRSDVIEEMEKLLLVWIEEKQMAGDPVSNVIICEKAKQLHSDIVKKIARSTSSGRDTEFKASSGWFVRFKKRSNILLHTIKKDVKSSSTLQLIKLTRSTLQVPEMGADGQASSSKQEPSSSFLTCSPLIASMSGVQDMSDAGPSSVDQMDTDAGLDDLGHHFEIKSEPVCTEIGEEDGNLSNSHSNIDEPSHSSSPVSGMSGPYLLKKETHCTTILDQLLKDDSYTDVTLTAEGQSIKAHKIVLCLSSTYFRQVLSKESNVQSVIVFRDFKFSELKSVINFMYTGEATVDAADLESFMKTADALEVTSLCDGQRSFPHHLIPSAKTPNAASEKTTKVSNNNNKRTEPSSSSCGSPVSKSRKTSGGGTPAKKLKTSSGQQGSTSSFSDANFTFTSVIKEEPEEEPDSFNQDLDDRGGDDSFIDHNPLEDEEEELEDPLKCDPLGDYATRTDKLIPGRCPFCPESEQQIRYGPALTNHMLISHPNKTCFPCDGCSKVFLKRGSYDAHKEDCFR